MSVTIKVLSIDGLVCKVECIDDKDSRTIMRSPVKFKQRTKASIEKAINDQFKAFKQPVWGGMSIVFYAQV